MAVNMSDNELRQRLKAAGIDAGPITNETRELYIRALRRKRGEGIGPVARRGAKVRNLENKHIPTRPTKRKFPVNHEEPKKKFKYGGLVGQSDFPTSSSNNSAGFTLDDSSNPDEDDCFIVEDTNDSFIAEASPSPPRSPTVQMEVEQQPNMLTMVAGSLQMIGSGVRKFVQRNFSTSGPIMKAAAFLNPSSTSPGKRNTKSKLPPQQRRMPTSSASVSGIDTPPTAVPPRPNTSERLTAPMYGWELQPGDVQICQRPDGSKWYLGRGGFGEVLKGLINGVDEVAVKLIKITSPTAVEQFKQEINTISMLRHRHILQFYGACVQPTCLYMVTELMTTDLYSALRKDPRYFWRGQFGPDVAVGVASGLHYLHSRKPAMVHRDIKSPNILLMDGLAKIADVGLARSKANSDMTAQKGFTMAWAAPEVVYRRRATEKIDIWSFGVILWEIASGSIPHVGQLVIPKTTPGHVQHLFHMCTAEEPTQRPTAAEIISRLKDH